MTRRKNEWHDHLTPCKKFSKCRNWTHFRGLAKSQDSLRRERLGLCVPCWDKLKESDAYEKICEEKGWSK